MSSLEPFNPLERFAEIERLVSKIYYRFSHLFMTQPEIRDFWWEMAKEASRGHPRCWSIVSSSATTRS